MIPDNVEKIIMTKEDYDRNVEQLLYDKINAEHEVERLENIIKEVREKIDNTTINCEGVAEDLIDDIYEILDKGSDEISK